MKYVTSLKGLSRWIGISGLVMIVSASLSATGPRITAAMFSETKNEIVTVENAPLFSMQRPDGGLAFEIVSAALKTQNETVTLTTYPVQKMVDYYLTQEKVLGVMGRDPTLSNEDKRGNKVLPVCLVHEHYYYYKPLHPKGIVWKGALSDLKGMRYGAREEENTAAYQKAGVKIVRVSALERFKKLKEGEIDFIKEPELSANMMLESNFKADKHQFGMIEPAPEESTALIIFNLKNSDAKAVLKKFREGMNTILENGQYQAIIEKYEGKNPLSQSHLKNFKKLWKNELAKK
ncbi:MAG: ABC transporter substrate-binding protein [Sulfuricurvum sp.]|nr:ABC transporter substrate-binding protein [Sulfuricurvum sp.]